jgi:hypothetical protein
MDNDEKTASRGDETLPTSDEQPMPDAPAEDALSDTRSASAGSAPKTLVFPGPRGNQAPRRLDESFGMPDLGFFPDSFALRQDEPANPPPPPFMPETERSAAEEPMAEAAPTTDEADAGGDGAPASGLPLNDDTGWTSTDSIGKPASLRARIDMQDDEDEPANEQGEPTLSQSFANDDETSDDEPEPPAPPRHEAIVTPFPGTVIHRQAEPAPSDMLRGAGPASSADIFDEIASGNSAGDDDPALPAEVPAANQDTLADAVQSALRNIYGGYSDPQDDRPDMGGYTVADALAGAADSGADEPAPWPGDRAQTKSQAQAQAQVNWHGQDVDPEPDQIDDGDGEGEGVLDYLYTQRRQDRASPQMGAEMSLSDYAARAASLGDDKWEGDADADAELDAEDERRVTPFPGRERGRGPDFHADSEPSIIRGGGGGGGGYYHDDIRPSLEADWGNRAFNTPQNARGQITPTYTPAVAAQPDPLPAQGPDSGHLLGAAGLGLIGGIALAGVLAVFVFNSFVDETGQSIDPANKVVERLSAPQSVANSVDARAIPSEPRQESRAIDTTPPARTDATTPAAPAEPQRVAAREPEPEPAPPAAAPSDGRPKLVATAANGSPETPIKLNITLSDADVGDALVSLKGLPKEARLSTGIDVGGGQWLLPPARLKELTVTAPSGSAGNYQLEAQLLKDDAQTSISDAVPFTLNIGSTRQAPAQPTGPAGAPGVAPKNDASRLALLPDEQPLPETDFLTQMLIRDGNKKMREGDITGARRLYEQAAQSGNAEAALAMGRSYDPTYFEKLNVKSGKPDPAMAFDWYKRALDGGLLTAKVKIDTLKVWLQR